MHCGAPTPSPSYDACPPIPPMVLLFCRCTSSLPLRQRTGPPPPAVPCGPLIHPVGLLFLLRWRAGFLTLCRHMSSLPLRQRIGPPPMAVVARASFASGGMQAPSPSSGIQAPSPSIGFFFSFYFFLNSLEKLLVATFGPRLTRCSPRKPKCLPPLKCRAGDIFACSSIF